MKHSRPSANQRLQQTTSMRRRFLAQAGTTSPTALPATRPTPARRHARDHIEVQKVEHPSRAPDIKADDIDAETDRHQRLKRKIA